jgi:signal transduction histidine kinase
VGHDLRTPLARLHLRTESLHDTDTRDAIGRDVAEMEAMIASLLAFLGGEADPEQPSRVDLEFERMLLARHGRLELIRPISRQAEKLFTEQSGVADVDIRVARHLDDDIRQVIEARVEKAIGMKPRCHVTVDPNLIAGIIVRVGDRVFDGSLHTHLEIARRTMVDRATDQIETRPDRFVSAS